LKQEGGEGEKQRGQELLTVSMRNDRNYLNNNNIIVSVKADEWNFILKVMKKQLVATIWPDKVS
jgi:hypothetical protein